MSAQITSETNLCVEEGMVAAVVDVAMPFLSFMCSSVVAFLLVLQTFAPHLTTSCHFSLFCARYSTQFGAIPKDFMKPFSVSLKCFFWPPWERLL